MARKSRRSSREQAAPASRRAPKQQVVVEDYMEEEEEGFQFKIEDPSAFITLGIYGFILLLPSIAIGIWSASTSPTHWDATSSRFPTEVI